LHEILLRLEFDNKSEDDEELKNLGEGFKRLVGAKGNQLSGGQKQRIAIARALTKKPKIYLFDEATSALDTKSEAAVQEALNKLSVETTSITVAHRVTAYKNCDKIFVLNEGKIIEQGKYEELIQSKGFLYSHVNGLF
jgi:ABC-type multidrug transport system fused ATPase/permease subunit